MGEFLGSRNRHLQFPFPDVMVVQVFPWETTMTAQFLVVLDRALTSGGPDPFRILRYDPSVRDIFGAMQYTTELEKSLESVRRCPDDVVVVVGPTFLSGYLEGKEKLSQLFGEAGLPPNRLVIGQNGGLPTLYEHAGTAECNVVNVVRRASQ